MSPRSLASHVIRLQPSDHRPLLLSPDKITIASAFITQEGRRKPTLSLDLQLSKLEMTIVKKFKCNEFQ